MFFDTFKALCDKKGVSCKRAAEEIGLSNSIATKWKKTGATPQGETLNLIADYFNVTADFLLSGATTTPAAGALPTLTAKDERDIAKQLDRMLGQLGDTDSSLMFDGEPLDEETRELLRISLENQLRMTKRLAKQKYTPKKYRKE